MCRPLFYSLVSFIKTCYTLPMKKSTLLTSSVFVFFFLALLIAPSHAQNPTELSSLIIKLWPEYDDPRLLVIIDGQLATPGSEIRLPIPAEAQLNAVATADGSGRLLKNEWHEEQAADGTRLLVMVPENPVFRVEYYTPFPIDGAKRMIKFELPAGYLNAEQVSIQTLLPPGSEDVELSPPADESGPTQDEAHIFQRSLDSVKNQPIVQEVSYANPSGALTVPESSTSSESMLQPDESAQGNVAPVNEKTSSTSLNPWIIALGVVAALLIIGGVVGLWMTRDRESEDELAPAPAVQHNQKNSRSISAKPLAGKKLDRFCRQCGKEFGPDDRFCRYCGAPRQSL